MTKECLVIATSVINCLLTIVTAFLAHRDYLKKAWIQKSSYDASCEEPLGNKRHWVKVSKLTGKVVDCPTKPNLIGDRAIIVEGKNVLSHDDFRSRLPKVKIIPRPDRSRK